MLDKLAEKLKQHPAEEERFGDIKAILGAGSTRADSDELGLKFIDYMEKQPGGMDAKVGVHIDGIVTAQRGVKKGEPGFKKAKGSTQNWLTSHRVAKNGQPAIVGKVDVAGVEARYFYIAPLPVLDKAITKEGVKVK